jgi:glycolate oxidase iron-sulfur subunit
VERRFERPSAQRRTRDALFAVLPYPRRLTALGAPLVAYRASGLQRRMRGSRVHRLLPQRLRQAEALAPTLTLRSLTARVPRRLAPAAEPRMRVAMLLGCVQRAFFADVNATTAQVLAAFGCEVVAPRGQGCCGALELHAGREESALRRARDLIASLEATGADRIAINSAGCGSTIKEYGHALADDPEWGPRAAAIAGKARDVTEILAELGPPEGALQPLPMRLAYHDACHLAHAQGVRDEPRALLGAIPGVELVAIPESAVCCGSAGIYNLVEPDPAADLGARKAANVRSVEPDALAAANPGCLIQIGAHLRAGGGRVVPTFHPVELVAASLAGEHVLDVLARRRRLLASAG